MTGEFPRCASAPCGSCPYRRDVPAGVWAADEYAKLPGYDGETVEQFMAGALGLFYCHQQDGMLCAGWVGCHDMQHAAATRVNRVDPMVFDYESPVPLFGSGAQAAAHGMSGIENPDAAARVVIDKLIRRRSDA